MYDCRASARSLSLRSCRCVYSQQAIEKLSRLMGLVAALRVRLKLAVAWAVGRPPMSFVVVVREQGAKETLTEGGTGTRSRLAGELPVCSGVSCSCLRGNNLRHRSPRRGDSVIQTPTRSLLLAIPAFSFLTMNQEETQRSISAPKMRQSKLKYYISYYIQQPFET